MNNRLRAVVALGVMATVVTAAGVLAMPSHVVSAGEGDFSIALDCDVATSEIDESCRSGEGLLDIGIVVRNNRTSPNLPSSLAYFALEVVNPDTSVFVAANVDAPGTQVHP